MLSQVHAFIQPFAVLLELAGAGIIVGGVLLATGLFALHGVRDRNWRQAYTTYRANLGRGILLGLELLVGADIISTITAPLTLQPVGLLGLVVLIRTFLSFSLETEIEGCWPWRRAARAEPGRAARAEAGRMDRR
ncbi:DUF1622 domain-containing protein [Brevundimonas sp. DS20]|uniref:DUF1622 domain-containing protein n=1 Tax=Brevundimonas sp. DS20 TaxID=1532555 RepID=UPI0006D1EEA3|nr:DUF1622 domain-containing protein [Brevundimonas sp. DS20]ALJ08131.1 hypothetical protein JL11_07125 [Brevundimonas sp. DS20]